MKKIKIYNLVLINILLFMLLTNCKKENDSVILEDSTTTNEDVFLWGLYRQPLPVKYFLKNINPIYVSRNEFYSSFSEATSNWEQQTPLKFKRVYSFDSCNIVVNCYQVEPFAGWAGTFWENGKRYKEIGIDNSIKWSLGPIFPVGYFDLIHILMHEIGHCVELHDLGTGRPNLMDGVLRNGLRTLHPDDLISFQEFYKMKNETGNNSGRISWESVTINKSYVKSYILLNNGKLLVYPILVNKTDEYSFSFSSQPIYPNSSKEYTLAVNKETSGNFIDTLKIVFVPFVNDTLRIISVGTANEPEILGKTMF